MQRRDKNSAMFHRCLCCGLSRWQHHSEAVNPQYIRWRLSVSCWPSHFVLDPLLCILPGSVRQKSPRAKLCHVRSLLPPRQPANIFRLDCLTHPPPSRLNRLPPSPSTHRWRQVEMCVCLCWIFITPASPFVSTKQCSRDNTALESSPSSCWHLLRLGRGDVWSSTCFNITSLICVNKSKASEA